MKHFIDLGQQSPSTEPVPKEPKRKWYPDFYMGEKDIGLREEHAGEMIEATVKLYVRSVTKQIKDGKTTYNSNIEVRAIRIDNAPEKHVQEMIESGLKEEQETK